MDRKFTEIENSIFEICKTLDEEITPFIEKLKLKEENQIIELCDKISFIIFENVEKAFSEHMKEKDIKPTVGEPEGFGSYCAAKIIERLPRIFTEDYIIKKKEEI